MAFNPPRGGGPDDEDDAPAWQPQRRSSGSAVAQPDPLPDPVAPGLRGKVAVVTGGATGLGRGICMEFARRGINVAFCFKELPGRDVSEMALLTETSLLAMGVKVFAARCDVRDRMDVDRFIARSKEHLGGIHFLVNNAGIGIDGALWRLTDEAWKDVMETNVSGAFHCIRAAAPTTRTMPRLGSRSGGAPALPWRRNRSSPSSTPRSVARRSWSPGAPPGSAVRSAWSSRAAG